MLFFKWCYIVEKQYIFRILFYKIIKNFHETPVSNNFLRKKIIALFQTRNSPSIHLFAFVIKLV